MLAAAAQAQGVVYPRLALYGRTYGNGEPLLKLDGTLNDSTLDQHARYHELVFEASPSTEYRPDIIAALLARNPNLTLLAYVPGHFAYRNSSVDTTIDFPYHYWQAVRDLDGFLYNRQGQQFPLCNVNLAKWTGGRYVVAEAIADLVFAEVLSTGLWDGVFFDIYCEDVRWVETPTDSFDYLRAGYPTNAAFHQGWAAGHAALAARLRSRMGSPGFVLVGNCGVGTRYADFNGWMRENFPFQLGGTWYANMFRDPGGYFLDERRFRAPRHNYVFSSADPPTSPYSSENRRKLRFGLASASLGEGFGVFGESGRDPRTYPYYTWWYDEYAVDLATGQSSTSPVHTGWLGQALGGPWQMIWLGSTPDAIVNPGFETDMQGWSFVAFSPASATREQGGAPEGSWSARVAVPQPGAFDYYVQLATTASIPLAWNRQYSTTFWAKAAVPRSITLSLQSPGPPAIDVVERVDLDTTWRRYQVVLAPGASGSAPLRLQFGAEAGDVWIDDVHFQEGVHHVYRRDFQNGIVLVNPSNSIQTVPLERSFQKIAGSVSPDVNDGTPTINVVLAPSDAIFLLSQDIYPPAAVNDLRRVP